MVGFTAGGTVVVPASVDDLAWTDRVGAFASRADLRAARRGIWLTGRMSGAVHQGLTARGWTVHETTLSAGTR